MLSAGTDCTSCPFARHGRPSNFLTASGPSNPDGLLVLGGGPTADDVKGGEPLRGPTGREMEEAMLEAGILRDRLMIAYAWACQPHEPRKELEERKAVACCRPLLLQQVAKLPTDTPTLLAGKWAMLAMTGREKGLVKNRGFVNMKWRIGDPLREEED